MKRPTRTTRAIDRELLRLLHGELPSAEAAALRRRMAEEPELAVEYGRLERSWEALELPPLSGAPPGFSRRVGARAAALPRPGSLSWGAAPAWVRAAAAACLIAGAAAGAGLGVRWSERHPAESAADLFGAAEAEAGESLAESYWGEVAGSTLADADASPTDEGGPIGETGAPLDGRPAEGAPGTAGTEGGSPL